MKGSLRIGKYMQEDTVYIEFEDETSGTRFLRATMTVTEYAKVMFNSEGKCNFELHVDNVGKVHQNKDVKVFVPNSDYYHSKDDVKKAVAPYEIDGWEAYLDDGMNHHKMVKGTHTEKGDTYIIGFSRFVDADKV